MPIPVPVSDPNVGLGGVVAGIVLALAAIVAAALMLWTGNPPRPRVP